MKVVTVEQMQRIESESDEAGHSYATMMEQAGRSVARALGARRDVRGKQVLVLVGPGNNGGDGLVAARYLSEAGARVMCYLYKDRNPAEDENFRLVLEGDVSAVFAEEDQGWVPARICRCGVTWLICSVWSARSWLTAGNLCAMTCSLSFLDHLQATLKKSS
jgi:hypothetical protein